MRVSVKIPKITPDKWWNASKKELTKLVEEANKANWPNQRDPVTKKKWAPRQQPTGTWPLLRRTGRMQDSAIFKPGRAPMSFVVTTTNYGPFNQYGTSKMPARRWLGIPPELGPKMGEIVFKSMWKGYTTIRS